MGKSGRRLSLAAALLLTAFWAQQLQAALTASIDRSRLHLGETARLTLSSDGDVDPGAADLSALSEAFDILQRSSNVSTSIVNGRSTRRRELVLEITPRRLGSLQIPAFEVDGKRSRAVSVEVLPEPDVTPGDEVVLFSAEVDRESVYVQGQLLLTLRVQQAVNLDSRSITELDIPDAFVKTLGQNSFQRSIDGRPWLVHEIRYAIFPETSGELRIPPQTFSGRLGNTRRSLFDTRPAGRLVRRRTEELVVPVLPRPAQYAAAVWLPARDLLLEEQWSAAPETLRVGESVTRTITITGSGLQGAQLPPLRLEVPAGLRAYPDQPVISDVDGEQGVTGVRSDSVAVVAIEAGDYQLPAVELAWWDTQSDRLQTARLPARRLKVLPAVVDASSGTDAGDLTDVTGPVNADAAATASASFWPALTALCALGWCASTLLWWRSRQRGSAAADDPSQTVGEARRADVLNACGRGDAVAAERALRGWLRAAGVSVPVVNWAEGTGDAALVAAVNALQERLYRGRSDEAWDGAALAAALRKLGPLRARPPRSPAAPLPDLYPASSVSS